MSIVRDSIKDLFFQNKHHLESLMQKKEANSGWLASCLQGNVGTFPHYMVQGGKASLEQNMFIPNEPPGQLPANNSSSDPAYLVNIPAAYYRLRQDFLEKILNIFKTEAFAKCPHIKRALNSRLAIVIGINAPLSLDSAKNLKVENFISALPKIDGISYRVFGFFWYPQWQTLNPNKDIYDEKRAYLLLKALSKKQALNLLNKLEGTTKFSPELASQIPFQANREYIKNSQFSRMFASHLERHSPLSPIYLSLVDEDFYSFLSYTEEGMYTLADRTASKRNAPAAMHFGYRAKENERPAIVLGIKIDMAVRSAMTDIIAYSAYIPEPGGFFCIRVPPGSHILKQLSFIGKGSKIETRRLIQNARLKKLFNDRVIFENQGGITIEAQKKMETIKNQNITEINPSNIKQKTVLKALRAVSQSHVFPKQWADNLYLALNTKIPRVTNATTPMMYIFKAFDPISRMIDMPGHYTKKNFDTVMQESIIPPQDSARQNLVNTAKGKLAALGFSAKQINLIEKAAENSAKAIYQELHKCQA